MPPGQYLVDDFPVLTAGPTPETALEEWTLTIGGEVEEPRRWTWDEFRALPSEEFTVDIHCVTKWSKLETAWEGVSLDTLLDGVDTGAEFLIASCDGGYTTIEDVIYRDELDRIGIDVVHTLTRSQPPGWTGRAGRVDAAMLAEAAFPATERPLAYVCGPTRFVEGVSRGLGDLGYEPSRIKTERFGPTGR